MDYMFANQFTITTSDNDDVILLRFANIAPEYDIDGNPKEPRIADQKCVIMTKKAFGMFKELLESSTKVTE